MSHGYRRTFLTFLVLNLCPAAAVAGQPCRVEPGKLRYEDNIACFSDPEVRQRCEYTHDPLFGADPQTFVTGDFEHFEL
jgi:hypothetical protein